ADITSSEGPEHHQSLLRIGELGQARAPVLHWMMVLAARCRGEQLSRDVARLMQRISAAHAIGIEPIAQLLVHARFESFHRALVGAGEDADEFAVAVVAD